MKNFPATQVAIENDPIITNVENILHAEWNINRYILDPTIVVNDTIPTNAATEDIQQEAEQISSAFPIESVVKSNRGNFSAYVINETRYQTRPVYVNQRARSESSWNNDTTWLWYDKNVRYKYWVTPLKSDTGGILPYNVGRIVYTIPSSKPANKISINFQKDHAFPVSWRVYVDTAGEGVWSQIASNANIPDDGKFELYRVTEGIPTSAGAWSTSAYRWTENFQNHINIRGIKIEIDAVNMKNGRVGIIEISPRLEADLTDMLSTWSANEELAEQDFIAPIGTASANTGSITLINDTGLFNEQNSDGLLYRMMDEEVRFKGYLKYGSEEVPLFSMLSDSWNTEGRNTTTVQLVDDARILQNTECNDMILSEVTVGAAMHMLFASLGLPQFVLKETKIKETPYMEKFYTKRENKVWEVIQEVCRGLQVAMFFDATGKLRMMTKEATFNPDSGVDYTFTSELSGGRQPDLINATKQESARFNKVVVRYNAINDFSLSGSQNQKMWTAADPWVIGAAQVVKNINDGDNSFWIDPNKPEALPNFSGTVVIEGINNPKDYEGKQYFCKNSTDPSKYIKVDKPSDWWRAVEKNNGEAPRFAGRIFLKDGDTFGRDFVSKNFALRQDWDFMEYQVGSNDGTKVNTGARHTAEKGSLEITTNYPGPRRLCVFRKQKNWNKFDRIGMKFRVESNNSKVGLVLWPQGKAGGAGYYFTVDPMSTKEIGRIIRRGDKDSDSTSAPPPEINGYVIRDNGNRVDMTFDVSKDFKTIPPLKIDSWSYLEVAVYEVTGGYEFEVFVDGLYCKTYSDTTIKLNRNEKAGMTFLGSGKSRVDKFYVVAYPHSALKGKDKDDSGFIVRRKDLWLDRKASGGDKDFNNYLRELEKKKKTKVFEYDFSGRFYAVAREKIKERVRFEQPALTSSLVVTNSAVNIVEFSYDAFGARFVLMNKSEKPQLLKGTRQTKVSGGDKAMSTYIYGQSFRRAEPQEIEYKKDSLIDRIGELPIEFESEWLQDRETANDLAKWVMDRFGENADVYSVEVFGNPLIEVGDIVTLYWPEIGLNSGSKWVVSRTERGWNNGLTTTLTVRRII